MPFVPIAVDAFVELHVKANPEEDPEDFRCRLRESLRAREAGVTCDCGEPIWVIGSAVAGRACFTCITGEAVPDDDYEIDDVC